MSQAARMGCVCRIRRKRRKALPPDRRGLVALTREIRSSDPGLRVLRTVRPRIRGWLRARLGARILGHESVALHGWVRELSWTLSSVGHLVSPRGCSTE